MNDTLYVPAGDPVTEKPRFIVPPGTRIAYRDTEMDCWMGFELQPGQFAERLGVEFVAPDPSKYVKPVKPS